MKRVDSVPCLCPSCDRVVLGPAKHLGKTVRCPGCQQRFTFSYPRPEVLAWLTEPVVRENTVLPLAVDDEAITIATQDPDDLELQQRLEFATGRRVRMKRAPLEAILAAIDKLYCAGVQSVPCPSEVLELVPEVVARENMVLPLAVDDEAITFATNDPDDRELQEKLAFIMARRVRLRKARLEDIVAGIDRLYGVRSDFPPGADESQPIVCECAQCHTRYVLGRDAEVTTFDELGLDSFPDSIYFIHGEPSWHGGDVVPPSAICIEVPAAVLDARRRRIPRDWICENCDWLQPYPWSSGPAYRWSSGPEGLPAAPSTAGAGRPLTAEGAPVSRASQSVFAATLAEAARKVPGEAVRPTDYVNPQIAWLFGVLALAVEGDDLHVAIPDAPEDYPREMTDLLGLLLRRPIKTVVIPVEEMKQGLAREYPDGLSGSPGSAPHEATPVAERGSSADPSEEVADRGQVQDVEQVSPVERLLQLLVAEAAGAHASEVLLRPTKGGIQIFERTPESPCPYLKLPTPGKRLRDQILNYIKHTTPEKGVMTFKRAHKRWSVRVSFQPTLHGQAVILSFLS